MPIKFSRKGVLGTSPCPWIHCLVERVSDLRPGRACSSSLGLPPAPGKGTPDPALSHGMFAGELEVLREDEANLTFSHPILVLPSHEAHLPHSPPREAARGENRLRCHSLQDQRNHHSLWGIMQGLGSSVTPVTRMRWDPGWSMACPEERSTWGTVPRSSGPENASPQSCYPAAA